MIRDNFLFVDLAQLFEQFAEIVHGYFLFFQFHALLNNTENLIFQCTVVKTGTLFLILKQTNGKTIQLLVR